MLFFIHVFKFLEKFYTLKNGAITLKCNSPPYHGSIRFQTKLCYLESIQRLCSLSTLFTDLYIFTKLSSVLQPFVFPIPCVTHWQDQQHSHRNTNYYHS